MRTHILGVHTMRAVAAGLVLCWPAIGAAQMVGPAPQYDWTGPYVGGHIGTAWGNFFMDRRSRHIAPQFLRLSPVMTGLNAGAHRGAELAVGEKAKEEAERRPQHRFDAE
jgi:hypothetical protein